MTGFLDGTSVASWRLTGVMTAGAIRGACLTWDVVIALGAGMVLGATIEPVDALGGIS
jgi:hypothetical protein